MTIITVEGEHELSIKRFYLPVVVETVCPHCQGQNKKDFEDEYLSYPVTNSKEAVFMECDHCEGEYEFDITLNLSIDFDENSRKLD
jgi:hypothetical protein